MVQKIQELVKEVVKYADELQKRQKSVSIHWFVLCITVSECLSLCNMFIEFFLVKVKDEESGTSDAVQSLQSVTLSLQKAKDAYVQRCLEYERLKNENPSASTKELEKLEGKCRKAQEDYKALVDKYNLLREDFERKMTVSCRVRDQLFIIFSMDMKGESICLIVFS